MQVYKEKYQTLTGARRTSTLEINTAKESWSPLARTTGGGGLLGERGKRDVGDIRWSSVGSQL